MDNRELAQELADFATDYCPGCGNKTGRCCVDARVEDCLNSDFIVSAYRDRMFTTRPDYPTTDFRRYVFEQRRSIESLHNQLRKNA